MPLKWWTVCSWGGITLHAGQDIMAQYVDEDLLFNALCTACSNEDNELYATIITNNDVKGIRATSLLWHAAQQGYQPGFTRVVQHLIALAGDEVAAADNYDYTFGHYAAAFGNTLMLEVLMQYAAHVSSRVGSDAVQPIHIAAGERLRDLPFQPNISDAQRVAMVNVLLSTASYNNKIESLHIAAKYNFPMVVLHLLEAGAPVDAFYNGTSPVCVAVLNSSSDVVDVLIEKGCRINLTNSTLGYPIHIAAHFGNTGILQSLLAAGADTRFTFEGKHAADIAIEQGHFEATLMLLENGCTFRRYAESVSQLVAAIRHEQAEKADLEQQLVAWANTPAQLQEAAVRLAVAYRAANMVGVESATACIFLHYM